MLDLFWVLSFRKIGHIEILWPNLLKVLILGEDTQFQISYFWLANLNLLWVPNFIALKIYFIFGTKFSCNEGIDTCFNVECVLLGHNFEFLGCYLVVNAPCLMVIAGYCLFPGVYWWLLLATGGYCLLPLVSARYHF